MTVWRPEDAEPVTTEEELREAVAPPLDVIANKSVGGIDALSRQFIEAATLYFVATTAPDGSLDVSPRGDPSGVLVFDGGRALAFADRPGNRRLDSLRNLVRHPRIGMLFVVPGRADVLRVNGRAIVVRAAPFFDELAEDGVKPALAVVVEVEELFIHCANAFRRSGAWEPSTWPDAAALPNIGRLFTSQLETAERNGW